MNACMTCSILGTLVAAAVTGVRAPDAAAISVQRKGDTTFIRGRSFAQNNTGIRVDSNRGGAPGTFVFDRGVFSEFVINGSRQSDVIRFGSKGTIISKKRGGVIRFGNDDRRDQFIFQNTIDVEKCSKKHGFRCHPLNHLQKVTIKQFGPEDMVILQGKRYGYRDLRGNGFPGVPLERLKVYRLGE